MAWIEQVNRREQKAKHFYDADTGKYRAEFTITGGSVLEAYALVNCER